MKVCFPVKKNFERDSEVYGHFGSAPAFVVVDTVSGGVTAIDNADRSHAHGRCNPVGALAGHEVDTVVAGGIGDGALTRLMQAGITVYKARARTVRENLELFLSGKLAMCQPGMVCTGHGQGGGCSHH